MSPISLSAPQCPVLHHSSLSTHHVLSLSPFPRLHSHVARSAVPRDSIPPRLRLPDRLGASVPLFLAVLCPPVLASRVPRALNPATPETQQHSPPSCHREPLRAGAAPPLLTRAPSTHARVWRMRVSASRRRCRETFPPSAAVGPADMEAARLAAALLLLAAQVSAPAGRLGRAAVTAAVTLRPSPRSRHRRLPAGLSPPCAPGPNRRRRPCQLQFPLLHSGASPRAATSGASSAAPGVLAAPRPASAP